MRRCHSGSNYYVAFLFVVSSLASVAGIAKGYSSATSTTPGRQSALAVRHRVLAVGWMERMEETTKSNSSSMTETLGNYWNWQRKLLERREG